MAIITIGGNIGSGKTSLAGRLAKGLGYDELHIGHIFRTMAREKNISIEEFYAALRQDPDIERAVDQQQVEFMKANDDIVMQGRVAWYFVKESLYAAFNIFLAVDQKIGAERSGRRKENAEKTLEVMMQANAARESDERERYQRLYGIHNFQDPKHYDFVLDTSHLTESETLAKVLEKINERMEADV